MASGSAGILGGNSRVFKGQQLGRQGCRRSHGWQNQNCWAGAAGKCRLGLRGGQKMAKDWQSPESPKPRWSESDGDE